MLKQAGAVVTDGRVVLGGNITPQPNLAIIPREIRVGKHTLLSDERADVLASGAKGKQPQVLPPQRELFIQTYQALMPQYDHVVSLHYLGAMDGAAREAQICRQLMQPTQQIDVYEAKTLEGGLEFLLQTAVTLLDEGASAAQLLVLLRYLETHMHTLLLAPGLGQRGPWAQASPMERIRSMVPSSETLWHFDPKQRRLQPIAQGSRLPARSGLLLQQRWGALHYAGTLRYRGYKLPQIEELAQGLRAAGVAETLRVVPVETTFIPCVPQTFVEILLVPSETHLARLRSLVQDPIWWKGAA